MSGGSELAQKSERFYLWQAMTSEIWYFELQFDRGDEYVHSTTRVAYQPTGFLFSIQIHDLLEVEAFCFCHRSANIKADKVGGVDLSALALLYCIYVCVSCVSRVMHVHTVIGC